MLKISHPKRKPDDLPSIHFSGAMLNFGGIFLCLKPETPETPSNGISPFLIGNTSSKGPFSIATLDYWSVVN